MFKDLTPCGSSEVIVSMLIDCASEYAWHCYLCYTYINAGVLCANEFLPLLPCRVVASLLSFVAMSQEHSPLVQKQQEEREQKKHSLTWEVL